MSTIASFDIKPFNAPLGAEVLGLDLAAPLGDCEFALPAWLQRAVEGASAEHNYLAKYAELQQRSPWRPNLTQAQIDEVVPAVHPVVRAHPETGRRALFVSEHFTTRIIGLPADESRALLDALFAHSTRPGHIYRHQWQPHDMVFWDNGALRNQPKTWRDYFFAHPALASGS